MTTKVYMLGIPSLKDFTFLFVPNLMENGDKSLLGSLKEPNSQMQYLEHSKSYSSLEMPLLSIPGSGGVSFWLLPSD